MTNRYDNPGGFRSVVATRLWQFQRPGWVFCRRDINCWAVGSGAFGGLAGHWNEMVAHPDSTPSGWERSRPCQA